MKGQSGIYKIQSKIKPERIYIGSAMDIAQRWRLHLSQLHNNKHHSYRLQEHCNRYGEVDLSFSIMLGCDIEDLVKTEQYFIDSYKPWFNICPVAGSQLGAKRSNESRQRMAEAAKGHIPWNKGKTDIYSEETLKKIRDARKLQISPMKGKKVSAEKLEKMRIASTGRKKSPEEVAKIRLASIGRRHRPESIEKIRNRPISEETHKRRKEGALRMWELRKLKESIENQESSICN
jgi:group I intron endonuclease